MNLSNYKIIFQSVKNSQNNINLSMKKKEICGKKKKNKMNLRFKKLWKIKINKLVRKIKKFMIYNYKFKKLWKIKINSVSKIYKKIKELMNYRFKFKKLLNKEMKSVLKITK